MICSNTEYISTSNTKDVILPNDQQFQMPAIYTFKKTIISLFHIHVTHTYDNNRARYQH